MPNPGKLERSLLDSAVGSISGGRATGLNRRSSRARSRRRDVIEETPDGRGLGARPHRDEGRHDQSRPRKQNGDVAVREASAPVLGRPLVFGRLGLALVVAMSSMTTLKRGIDKLALRRDGGDGRVGMRPDSRMHREVDERREGRAEQPNHRQGERGNLAPMPSERFETPGSPSATVHAQRVSSRAGRASSPRSVDSRTHRRFLPGASPGAVPAASRWSTHARIHSRAQSWSSPVATRRRDSSNGRSARV